MNLKHIKAIDNPVLRQKLQADGWTVEALAQVEPKDLSSYGIDKRTAKKIIKEAGEVASRPPEEVVATEAAETAPAEPVAESVRVKRIREMKEQ